MLRTPLCRGSCNVYQRSWLPELRIFAPRDDGSDSERGDYVVAIARVIDPISGDRGDVLIRWGFLQQVKRHSGVTDIVFVTPTTRISSVSSSTLR